MSAPEPRPQRCQTCRHWELAGEGLGHCHRRPPTADADGFGVFPTTTEAAWCGDWTHKPNGYNTGPEITVQNITRAKHPYQ